MPSDFRFLSVIMDRAPNEFMSNVLRDPPRRRLIPNVPPVGTQKENTQNDNHQRVARNYLRRAHKMAALGRTVNVGEGVENEGNDGLDVASVCTTRVTEGTGLYDSFPKITIGLRQLMRSTDKTPLAKAGDVKASIEQERTDDPDFDYSSERRVIDLLCYYRTLISLEPILQPDTASVEYQLAVSYCMIGLPCDAIAHAEAAMSASADYAPKCELVVSVCTQLMDKSKEAVSRARRGLTTHCARIGCSPTSSSCLPYLVALMNLNFLAKDYVKAQEHMVECIKLVNEPHASISKRDLYSDILHMVQQDVFDVYNKIILLVNKVGKCVKQGQDMLYILNGDELLKNKLEKEQDLGPALEVRVMEAKQRLDVLADDIRDHVDVVEGEINVVLKRVKLYMEFLKNYFMSLAFDKSEKTLDLATGHAIPFATLFYLKAVVGWLEDNEHDGTFIVWFETARKLIEAVHGKKSLSYLHIQRLLGQAYAKKSFKDTLRQFALVFVFPPCDDMFCSDDNRSTIMDACIDAQGILEGDIPSPVTLPSPDNVLTCLREVVTEYNNGTIPQTLVNQCEQAYTLLTLIKNLDEKAEEMDSLLTQCSNLFLSCYGEGHEMTSRVLKKLHKRLKPVLNPVIIPSKGMVRVTCNFTVTCDTPGATIYYNWGHGWKKYIEGFKPPGLGKQKLEVKAVKSGMLDAIVQKEMMVIS